MQREMELRGHSSLPFGSVPSSNRRQKLQDYTAACGSTYPEAPHVDTQLLVCFGGSHEGRRRRRNSHELLEKRRLGVLQEIMQTRATRPTGRSISAQEVLQPKGVDNFGALSKWKRTEITEST